MIRRKKIYLSLLAGAFSLQAFSQSILFDTQPATGAISNLRIENDGRSMNWMLQTDGSQYSWIKENYGWGLGYFTETKAGRSTDYKWELPLEIRQAGKEVVYQAGDIAIEVRRYYKGNDLVEEYTFTNQGKQAVTLSDIGIYTPFNDNYPGSQVCLSARTHTHIWDGQNAAYVNATHMGARPPHLGLVLTEGSVKSYEIWERGPKKGHSHNRGVIAMNPADAHLKPGERSTVTWHLFSHSGWDDFRSKLLQKNSILAQCNRYVFKKGETARLEIRGNDALLQDCVVRKNGTAVAVRKSGGVWLAEAVMEQAGVVTFDITYDKGKQTRVECMVFDDYNQLIENRVRFIIDHQQLNDPSDPRDGAYLVYDNETERIYLNDTPNVNPVDRDEGAERIGMGILLTQQYLRAPDEKIKHSLIRYAKFIREQLQDESCRTWSSTDKKGRNRAYNYVWISHFYFQMYHVTGNKQYLTDAYQTLKSMYSQFKHGFYAIGTPIRVGLQSLKAAGMMEEYESLKADFIKIGDTYIKNGINYPRHEVNYEQSIVAPALMVLTQLYLETGMEKYLEEAKRQLPVLEAFGGFQPSYHLNEISIRHWDGYWFGKYEKWGDTFPHYWSTLTGAAYYYYFLCTQDISYKQRAENIVRNNLCLFTPEGRASCAYIYPCKVNGEKAQFYDPYANDQDFGLVYYLLVNEDL